MKFKDYSQDQMYLIPPDINSLIPQEDMCRTINDIVNEINLKHIINHYKEEGNVAYHPKMMLKIIFYSYYLGIYSSRKIVKELQRNIYFWYLSGRQYPDFRTICRFRDKHKEDIEMIFKEIINLCNSLGMIKLENVAIDGSKIQADASRDRIEKITSGWIEKGIEIDRQEDEQYGKNDGIDRVPDELADAKVRKQKIRDAYQKLKKEKNKSNKEHQINTTDPDSRLMKTKGNVRMPSYNAQITVDEENQIIISAGVIQDENDKNAMAERLEEIKKTLGINPQNILADSGYWNIDNVKYLKEEGIYGVICDKNIKNIKQELNGSWDGKRAKKYSKDLFKYDAEKNEYICPEGNTLTGSKSTFSYGKTAMGKPIHKYAYKNEQVCKKCEKKCSCTSNKKGRVLYRLEEEHLLDEMKARIRDTKGFNLYKKRMKIVEPVFGNIKWNKGLKRFNVRGLKKVNTQFLMACCIHNMEKINKYMDKYRKNINKEVFSCINLMHLCLQY